METNCDNKEENTENENLIMKNVSSPEKIEQSTEENENNSNELQKEIAEDNTNLNIITNSSNSNDNLIKKIVPNPNPDKNVENSEDISGLDSKNNESKILNEEAGEFINPENITTENTAHNSSPKSESTFLPEATIANYLQNSGLGFLQSQYGTDDSDEEESDDDSVVEVSNKEQNEKEYREKIIVNSDSDNSDVEYLSTEQQQRVIDLEELIDEDDDEQQIHKNRGPVRVKGELLLEDLPPIQDLKITVPETECVDLGKIHSIVDQLVLVDSIPGTVPLDLDTVLFMDKGKTVLGEVFDVLGQIKSPLYCVRFNSNKQIKEKGIEVGQIVYVAPRTEHTQFIILDNLMRIRGSDASWENDIEPSDKHRDFSDDEEEISYRRGLHNKDRPNEHNDLTKRTRTVSTSSSMYSGSIDVDEINENQFQRNNYGGNQRFPGQRRGAYQQRPKFQRGGNRGRQNHYQNAPRFNYDNSGGSWHANYNNNYGNNYYQPQQQSSYPQESYTPTAYPMQAPQQRQQSPVIAQSNLYPNPYAIRAPYIPPNVMQQPLFPPTPSGSNTQQTHPNYPQQ